MKSNLQILLDFMETEEAEELFAVYLETFEEIEGSETGYILNQIRKEHITHEV